MASPPNIKALYWVICARTACPRISVNIYRIWKAEASAADFRVLQKLGGFSGKDRRLTEVELGVVDGINLTYIVVLYLA